MGHATLALASMFGYDPVKAKGHLADTHARATGLSRREQQQIAIIDTWINGNSPRALEMIREHLLDFPPRHSAAAPRSAPVRRWVQRQWRGPLSRPTSTP